MSADTGTKGPLKHGHDHRDGLGAGAYTSPVTLTLKLSATNTGFQLNGPIRPQRCEHPRRGLVPEHQAVGCPSLDHSERGKPRRTLRRPVASVQRRHVPAGERYWPFQAYESFLFFGLALAVGAFTVWWVRRLN